MIDPEITDRLRWHAGLHGYEDWGTSIAACTWSGTDRPADLEAAVHDVLEILGRLNLEFNGPIPSEQCGESELPRDLVYAIAEIDQMLRGSAAGLSVGATRALTTRAVWLI